MSSRAPQIDITRPLPRKTDVPVIDMHCHVTGPSQTARMIEAARRFGIVKLVGICRLPQVRVLRRRFGSLMALNVRLDYTHTDDADKFIRTNVALIRQAHGLGCCCIKFWYKPQFNEQTGFFFDDWRLDAIFETMVELDLPALVHIADPDLWWQSRYADHQRFLSKRLSYQQLTNTLGRFGQMKVVVAHMGGDPEHLDHLTDLLNSYPNLYLDTSGTRWVVRELSAKPQQARQFFVRFADRLMFGSDLVAYDGADLRHHCSRYWAHQFLYEQSGYVRSPIEDPDANGPVYLAGLDLPATVLRRLYWDNAASLFKLQL